MVLGYKYPKICKCVSGNLVSKYTVYTRAGQAISTAQQVIYFLTLESGQHENFYMCFPDNMQNIQKNEQA